MERYFNKSTTSNMPERVDLNKLPRDPSKRKRIADYNLNQHEDIRRKYLMMAPYQPRPKQFEPRLIGKIYRRFNPNWYKEYGGNWLEYSEEVDRAYCLCCYLFRDNIKGNKPGSDAFVVDGYCNWKKPERFVTHVGDRNSFHNKALKNCEDLLKIDQSIPAALHRQSELEKTEHLIRVNAAIDVCRYLLHQGQPFRGHDESEESENKGNYRELMEYTISQNDVVAKDFKNAPINNQMLSPKIQKSITECFAKEVLSCILQEIGNDVFSLLVDECRDVSDKEQMAVVLRYVINGLPNERFVGVVHVEETTAAHLKSKIDFMIAEFGLSLKQVRGQGYDGASNMAGELNGLQAKIMRENSSAYFVHCFAHKLNLVVVAVAKKITDVGDFFDMISVLVTVVGSSCKRKDKLRENHQEEVRKAIGKGEIATGTGLNQELCLQRPGDTRWNSHYRTLVGLSKMFPSVVKVLEYVEEDGADPIKKRQANGILKYFQTFDSAFYLHMMMIIFALTNGLSKTFQRKVLDIVNAMSDVESTKRELVKLRSQHGWNDLLNQVHSFCEKNDISVMDMANEYVNPKKIRHKTGINNEHHYRIDCFYAVLDLLVQELNSRFNATNSELLCCMSSLSPSDQFCHFNEENLLKLARFYPDDFNDLVALERELHLYLDNVTHDTRFASLENIDDLAELMVTTKKHLSYPLVYRLMKLALTLPVATATVERCFSAMKIVKNVLRNKLSDDFMSNCLICFVEKGMLNKIPNEVIVERFHAVKDRRGMKRKAVG